MSDQLKKLEEKVQLLQNKYKELTNKQNDFYNEMFRIKREILELRSEIKSLKGKEQKPEIKSESETKPIEEQSSEESSKSQKPYKESEKQVSRTAQNFNTPPKKESNLEKYIGENLINKVGILILVIGVGIGAKYAIDNQLISPLTRIILGYILGLGLMFTAMKLKKDYMNFSAVLLSGSMAVMYFITFAAYNYYELIPQSIAFLLMVVFTGFTVLSAINYDKQVIAQIGLVGAYAVPILLSDNTGRVEILFSYMALINIGILLIALKKYWKPLFYSSFSLTWIIYFFWYVGNYNVNEYFTLALVFLFLFFAIFYTIFISYKLKNYKKFQQSDIVLLLLNSFIFYGIGYNIFSSHEVGTELLGLFTLGNAIIHSLAAYYINKRTDFDSNLFYFAIGLVLVFTTLAIPVQLDGNWVTLIWAGESAVLFWIGRSKKILFYEELSYVLMGISFLSLLHDWKVEYGGFGSDDPSILTPIFNIQFLSSFLYIIIFLVIYYIHNSSKQELPEDKKFLNNINKYIVPVLLLFVTYMAFYLEINNYWIAKFNNSILEVQGEKFINYDIRRFKFIWLLNYSILFLTILSALNLFKIRSRSVGIANIFLNLLASIIFLTVGLYTFSELRVSYLEQTYSEYFNTTNFNIIIRYVSFAFFALIMYMNYRYVKDSLLKVDIWKYFELFFHISIIWIASSELINWLDISGFSTTYKFGLSILWGVYSILLIVLGIRSGKKYLRLSAIVLLSATVLKLFFYDTTQLNTIPKTILFVSVGIVLLIVSFLYNKYKSSIEDENIE